MTDTEHTKLIFLFNALNLAPHKKNVLIDIIDKPSSSIDYKSILDELRNSSDIISDVDRIRKSIL